MKYKMINEVLEIPQKYVDEIAKAWVEISAKVKPTDNVMILYDIGGRQLAKAVAKLSAKKGARVWYRVRELDLDAILVKNLPEKEIARYYANTNNEIMQADVVFMIRAARDPNVMAKVPSKNMRILGRAQKPIYSDYRVNYTNWQLIYWPTLAEAEIENMDFEKYLDLYISACTQPWEEIQKANEIIAEVLNKGKELTLLANINDPDKTKHTQITLSIEGMDFLPITINRNFPGAEVYSSPVKNSVNGVLYGKGTYMLGHSFKTVKNIRFEIQEGKIIKATADRGEKELNEFLDTDEGARYFGEIAFGTNPGLRQRLFNPLLNEKVGGSFHITPGNAYENEEYKGKLVRIDNGNRSDIHWDITILMLPAYGGGEVILDGKTIQKNGKWLIKGTEVLNRGL